MHWNENRVGLSWLPVEPIQGHSIGSDQIEWVNRWGSSESTQTMMLLPRWRRRDPHSQDFCDKPLHTQPQPPRRPHITPPKHPSSTSIISPFFIRRGRAINWKSPLPPNRPPPPTHTSSSAPITKLSAQIKGVDSLTAAEHACTNAQAAAKVVHVTPVHEQTGDVLHIYVPVPLLPIAQHLTWQFWQHRLSTQSTANAHLQRGGGVKKIPAHLQVPSAAVRHIRKNNKLETWMGPLIWRWRKSFFFLIVAVKLDRPACPGVCVCVSSGFVMLCFCPWVGFVGAC